MKPRKTLGSLDRLTFAYASLYLFFIGADIIISVSEKENYPLAPGDIAVYVMFTIFLTGIMWTLYSKVVAGILLLIWNIGLWTIEGLLTVHVGGLGIIAAIPLLLIGVMYIVEGYEETHPWRTRRQQWKLGLQSLLIVYSVLYIIAVVSWTIAAAPANFLTWPHISLLLLLAIYITGFLLSWKFELLAGWIFVFWFVLIVCVDWRWINLDIGVYLSIPVFLQGLLYMVFHWYFLTHQIKNTSLVEH